jgi:TP901-1 family phage major tail protein
MKKFFRKAAKILTMACVMAMFGVFGAVTLATNPSTSSATVGKDYLLYVNKGTVAAPVWQVVGGQRSASLSMSADEIDVSDKASGGWAATLAGMRSWSIDLDALLLLNDAGINILRQAFMQGKQINIKLRYPDNSCQIGWASITDFSSEAPHDGEASLSGTLNGVGPISDISQTVSIAEPTDLIYYIESNAYASVVTLAGAAVEAVSYTATVAGELTLKSSYLATLAAGEHIFYVTLSVGGQVPVVVTVTA